MMDFTLKITLKSFEMNNDKPKSRHLFEMLVEVPDLRNLRGKRHRVIQFSVLCAF